jgi:MYXO-CTERM domain-containing protein
MLPWLALGACVDGDDRAANDVDAPGALLRPGPRRAALPLDAPSLPLRVDPAQPPEVVATVDTFAGRAFVAARGALVYALPPAVDGEGGWSLVEDFGAPTDLALVDAAPGAPALARDGVALRGLDEVRLETPAGVTVRLRAAPANVEKLFEVPPGVSPDDIAVAVRGATLGVSAAGTLIARTGVGDVEFTAPRAYQAGRAVDVRYRLVPGGYGFAVGPYDRGAPLTIDPLLQSTYYGVGVDEGLSGLYATPGDDLIALAVVGAAGYPGTAGGAQAFVGGTGGDALLVRFDETLTTIEQATYFGGTGRDLGFSLSPHPSGDPVLSAWTGGGWPATAGAHNTAYDGLGDDFGVARVASTLTTVVAATYWNGGTAADQQEGGNCVDPATGDIYVVGEHVLGADPTMVATGFDLTKGGGTDAVLLRYNATLSTLLGNTFKGLGSEANSGVGGEPGNESFGTCAVDPMTHDVIVTGGATGTLLGSQATAGAYVDTPTSVDDPMICRYTQDLTSLVACTHLGITAPAGYGNYWAPRALLVHPSGDVYVVHDVPTTVTWIPATAGAFQTTSNGGNEIVVTRLSADLSTVLGSTFVGTAGDDVVSAAQVQPDGALVLGGSTTGTWPTTPGALQPDRAGAGTEGVVFILEADLSDVRAATYIGGPADNEAVLGVTRHTNGSLYVSGRAGAALPGVVGGGQAVFGGGAVDGFVMRISANLALTECGDGVREGDEGCDDGDVSGGDGCSALCAVEGGWTCDGLTPDVCTTTCGDGVRAGDEACDDGDAASGDGCDAACELEPGWTCVGGNPDVCEATCGDELVVGDETCDDGNTADGDGCSAACLEEGGGGGFLEPGVGVTGGGCAIAGGGGSSGGALLLLVLGALAARRRRAVAVLGGVGAMALAAPAAQAQATGEPRDFSVERLQLGADRQAILGLDSAWLPAARTWDVSLWLGYADDPLTLYMDDGSGGRTRLGSLVDTRVGGELAAAYAPTDWLQVALAAPLIVAQDRPSDLAGVDGMVGALGGFGLGDLRVTPAVRLLREGRGPALALRLALALPTAGASDYRGDDGVAVTPSLSIGKRLGRVRALATLGYALRPTATLGDLTVDDELRLGLGATIAAHRKVDLDLTLNTATAASAPGDAFNRNYVELIGGPRIAVTGRVTAFAAVGGGLDVGYGTPDLRLLAGVRIGSETTHAVVRPDDDLADGSDRDQGGGGAAPTRARPHPTDRPAGPTATATA